MTVRSHRSRMRGLLSGKLVKNAQLKVYPGARHGILDPERQGRRARAAARHVRRGEILRAALTARELALSSPARVRCPDWRDFHLTLSRRLTRGRRGAFLADRG
jgi:hypothetical protein